MYIRSTFFYSKQNLASYRQQRKIQSHHSQKVTQNNHRIKPVVRKLTPNSLCSTNLSRNKLRNFSVKKQTTLLFKSAENIINLDSIFHNPSLVSKIAFKENISIVEKEKIQSIIPDLKNYVKKLTRFDWNRSGRQDQKPPHYPKLSAWDTWLILAGRGFGKTRAGAETIRYLIFESGYKRIALIGQSIKEAQSVMVDGDSGLLNTCSPDQKPVFEKTHNRLRFKNGAIVELYGGNRPERLRGPQFDAVWIDEIAKFQNPEILYDQIRLCLRLGPSPKCIITTTPKPTDFIKKLVDDPNIHVTRGSTFDNAENLSPQYIEHMKKTYEHTRLGAQELQAELLLNHEGALWNRDSINYGAPLDQHWKRIIIAIDPATTCHDKSDETGIVVLGLHNDGIVYVLEDLSGKYSPHQWGEKVVKAYMSWKADRVVAEINKGGDLVERILKSIYSSIAFKPVRATRGKYTRAEPVAALYSQNKVKHVRHFELLEKQMCTYIPTQSKSPDRLDALVWGMTDLLLTQEASFEPKIWMY
ncbi:MAG: ATP-binding protein [Candidatus Puniceispirillum sp.]|nr:ATP-binding protein [Candidatus Pelagibacter sp.]MBA4282672.1 ATP-binding protein [Candidatus Puniceispirillum sp.]